MPFIKALRQVSSVPKNRVNDIKDILRHKYEREEKVKELNVLTSIDESILIASNYKGNIYQENETEKLYNKILALEKAEAKDLRLELNDNEEFVLYYADLVTDAQRAEFLKKKQKEFDDLDKDLFALEALPNFKELEAAYIELQELNKKKEEISLKFKELSTSLT